jgi:small subunit ribosomal protein S2
MADVSLKDLLEAGAHFGHQTRRWNPKMKPFIFGNRGGVHIIDLTKTSGLLDEALKFVRQTTATGGSILFVGTKRQAQAIVIDEAKKAGMPYVTERWLGGMLTNFRTIRAQITRLKKLDAGLDGGDYATKYNKKELLDFTNEAAALERIFGGIKNMDGLPKAMFVIDVPNELIAVAEARRLGIPVVAITDTNANPDLIDYIIPANDDAIKAIRLIANAVGDAAKEGASEYAAKKSEREAEAVAV